MNRLVLLVFVLLMAPTVLGQNATLEEQIRQVYCEDDGFIERAFSSCQVPDDGVCDDGENLLLDKDCTIDLREISTGRTFQTMWFMRLLLIISVLLFVKGSKAFPYVVAGTVGLIFYNGAFTQGLSLGRDCMDVNFLLNAGYCVMPGQPLLGWGLLFALGVWAYTRFRPKVL